MSKIQMATSLLATGSWVTACMQDAAKNTPDSIKKK